MKEVFGVAGGLALFVFGMNLMSEGLKKAAGERLRKILETVTRNPLIGAIVGFLVTFIIQSSSATTVMVIGFVNARLMSLPQAIGVIMGANIGTTVTAQLIAFKIGHYAPLIAAIGFLLYFIPKRKIMRYIGETVFGFGVLFIGLNMMSEMLVPLGENPLFAKWMVELGHLPILGVLLGTGMTVVIQSSSAAIGVLQSVASQAVPGTTHALVPLKSAIPILLGSNIGTTITAWLATLGANRQAKRAAMVHTLFNVLGALLALPLLGAFTRLVLLISPKGPETSVIMRQIANAHTTFNVVNTMIWLPLAGVLAFLVKKIIPGEERYIERGVKFLDNHVLNNPAVALELSTREVTRMGEFCKEMLEKVREAVLKGQMTVYDEVVQIEDSLDVLKRSVIHYLSVMTSRVSLTEPESVRLASLMQLAGDFERIGDHCLNVMDIAKYKQEENLPFSEQATAELDSVFEKVGSMLLRCTVALETENASEAGRVLQLEEEIDREEARLRTNHLERLNQGKCVPKSAVAYVELMKNLERMADHCNNVAEAVIQMTE